MLVYTNPLYSAQRPHFADTFPIEKEAHRTAQRQMFGAARTAGLPTDERNKEAMLRGINQFLGLRIESRTQLTVQEMNAVTVGIDSGAFLPGWKIIPGIGARVKISVSVDISAAAAELMAADVVPVDYAGYDDHFPFC
jgi:hypothetical protein